MLCKTQKAPILRTKSAGQKLWLVCIRANTCTAWYWYACWPKPGQAVTSKDGVVNCEQCNVQNTTSVTAKNVSAISEVIDANNDSHCGLIKYPEPEYVEEHIKIF